MVAAAARDAFFTGVVDRKGVSLTAMRRPAMKKKHRKDVRQMLVREVQRFLRRGLGLDLVPYALPPVQDRTSKTAVYDLKERREWRKMAVVARHARKGSLPVSSSSSSNGGSRRVKEVDGDAVLHQAVSREERARRAVCFAAFCFVVKSPRQRLTDEELVSKLLSVDPAMEETFGGDWIALVRRWLRDQGLLTAETETTTLDSGERKTSTVWRIAGGARALVGAPAAFDMMLQSIGQDHVDETRLEQWYRAERLAFDDAEGDDDDADDDDQDDQEDDDGEEDEESSSRGKRSRRSIENDEDDDTSSRRGRRTHRTSKRGKRGSQ